MIKYEPKGEEIILKENVDVLYNRIKLRDGIGDDFITKDYLTILNYYYNNN